jgi:hypothetical protein
LNVELWKVTVSYNSEELAAWVEEGSRRFGLDADRVMAALVKSSLVKGPTIKQLTKWFNDQLRQATVEEGLVLPSWPRHHASLFETKARGLKQLERLRRAINDARRDAAVVAE